MSDPLAFNKIVAGFLCACLLLIGVGKFASFMQGGDGEHHGDHHSEGDHSVSKNAFPIEIPETSITEASAIASTQVKIVPILALIASANLDEGKKLSKKCAACHSFNAGGPNKVGPNLWNVLNREMGKVDGYKYSKALTAFGGEWDYSSLNKFLLKPKEYMKGTKMNYAGLKKENDRANILLWLRSLADVPADLPTEDEIQKEIEATNS